MPASLSEVIKAWALADVLAALSTIQSNQEQLMSALSDLTTAVGENTKAVTMAVAIIKNGATAEQLAAVKATVDASTKTLADAINPGAPPAP
jgi:hypothetical protein